MTKIKTELSNEAQPAFANPMLAADLLKWLEDERTVLFNTAAFMIDPVEYRNTMDVVDAINKTLKYVELSKICR
jgi:hypothetical protein